MSKAELLSQLDKFTPEERAEIRAKLDELDGDRWLDNDELTPEQKRLLEARLEACEKNPEAGSSWEEVQARIHARLRS